MKSLLILATILFSFHVNASRLIEVEDYYSKKATDFVKTRYPRKAFSVYVKVDADQSPQVRELASENRSLNLPYFDKVNKKEVSFWDRKDVSLGTLISYLKSVFVKVDIDGDFSEEEMQKLKAEIFQHLKLSEVYDRIEINKRQWHSEFSLQKNKTLLFGGLAVIFGLLGILFIIFQSGIRSLVKGLSQPLSEIGRSAENVANSSGAGLDSSSRSSFQLAGQRWQEGELSADQIKNAKSEILRLSEFLSRPTGELIQKIEEFGEQDPFAMGSIFSEMKIEDLHSLIQWARGDWWRVAITQTTPLSHRSLEVISEISHLYIRKQLLEKRQEGHDEDNQFECILARLSLKQFGELFENQKFEEAEKVLRTLPQDTMINVGKYLYPGRWAELLEAKKEVKLVDVKKRKIVEERALEICPLRDESELQGYFKEADLLNFLDAASTKDERDVYRALDTESWIKQERVPFYNVFDQSDEALQYLATDLPLELWALAITSCDRQECDKLYKHFNSKQKFMMREFKARFQSSPPSVTEVVRSKKRIMNLLLANEKLMTTDIEEAELNEIAA